MPAARAGLVVALDAAALLLVTPVASQAKSPLGNCAAYLLLVIVTEPNLRSPVDANDMRPFGLLRVDRLHDTVDVGTVLALDLEAGLCLVDQ
jgi:hypothetical protein